MGFKIVHEIIKYKDTLFIESNMSILPLRNPFLMLVLPNVNLPPFARCYNQIVRF